MELALARKQKQRAVEESSVMTQNFDDLGKESEAGSSSNPNNNFSSSSGSTISSTDQHLNESLQKIQVEYLQREFNLSTIRQNHLKAITTEYNEKIVKVEAGYNKTANLILTDLRRDIEMEYQKKDGYDTKYRKQVQDAPALEDLLNMNNQQTTQKCIRLQTAAQLRLDAALQR
ncbi:hypothetical protein BGZ76_001923, partial [Entomortierella beljakovae]